MKFSLFVLASVMSLSASASTLNCKVKVFTDEVVNALEFENIKIRPAIEEEFSTKIEDGSAFLNNIVAKSNVDASFNFGVSVENNKIVDVSIEDEMSHTSSGLEQLSLSKINFSARNQELDSSLHLNCEIQ